MKTNRRDNYLRSYRKKSGLTQSEVGFLLGRTNGAQISRYEKCRRLPPLEIALALEALLGVPVSQLFAGIHESANADIRKRLAGWRSALQTKATGLSFGDYVRILRKPDQWKKLGLPLDQNVFIEKLEAARRIRNKVMHFTPNGIAQEDLSSLRDFAGLFTQIQEIMS